jgi:hypothetical protein
MAYHAALAAVIVERLSRDRLPAAYPLMRQVAPALSLQRWMQYARKLAGGREPPRKGILVARRRGATYPSGAVCYHLERGMTHESILVAEHFIALDLLHPEVIHAALVAELESIAKMLGCTAVRSIVHGGGPALLDELRVAGHETEGVTLTKTIVR